jgi:uncharacterized protein
LIIHDQLAPQVPAETLRAYDSLTKELRTTGKLNTLPADAVLPSILNAGTIAFLADADKRDPVHLAANIPDSMTVLLSCSEPDIQVSCGSLTPVRTALKTRLGNRFTDLKLAGTNHVLRVTGEAEGIAQT